MVEPVVQWQLQQPPRRCWWRGWKRKMMRRSSGRAAIVVQGSSSLPVKSLEHMHASASMLRNFSTSARFHKPAGDVYQQIASTLQQLHFLRLKQSSIAHGVPNLISPGISNCTSNEMIAAINALPDHGHCPECLETSRTRDPQMGEHRMSHHGTVPASQHEQLPRGINTKRKELLSGLSL